MNNTRFNVYDAKYTLLHKDAPQNHLRLSNISPMELQNHSAPAIAKRASPVSKVALQHLLACERSAKPDYTIFISRFGELPFIEKNNEDNANQLELSPTSFSHSVHNTLSCLYSIFIDSRMPSTSLATNESAIKAGVWEAVSYLSSNVDKSNCLIVIYDSHLPQRYEGIAQSSPCDFILSFIVSKQDQGNLDLFSAASAFNQAKNHYQELHALDNLCAQSKNQYREIQRIYAKESPVSQEYLTEYYL